MNVVKFGNLEIGRIPRVIGTLCTFDSLARLGTSTEKSFDIAEVRLDEVGSGHNWLNECKSIEASGTPVIFTLRSAAEGGKSHLENNERRAIFETALPVVSAIDVEFQSGLADSLYGKAKALGKALLSS